MKTYKQVITEAEYFVNSQGKWGIVGFSGPVDGGSHETARTHEELAEDTGHAWEHTAQYFHEPSSDTLCLRTHGSLGLHAAIKHFDKLPHGKTGNVMHDHTDHDECDHEYGECNNPSTTTKEGKRYAVLAHMKKLLGDF